jgi:hypothetical protein
MKMNSIMRSVEIRKISHLIRRVWLRHPDQRLGQLLSNLLGPGPQDLFHIEDDEWEKLLTNTKLEIH